MTRPSTSERLGHMLEAARKALTFSAGKTRADLDRDEILVLALTRLIEVLGEAAKSVPEEYRARQPAIPWKAITGTRDWLVHAYFRVDLDQLWQILSRDLPALVAELEKVVPPS